MTVETSIADQERSQECSNVHLLQRGLSGLDPFLQERAGLETALKNLVEIGDETTAKMAKRLQHQLDTLEPSITMIGQVKAGKTSLVNAMVGWPALLPADVNPWTSVVTSLHLDPKAGEADDTKASFRFFDHTEWDRLLDKGGRIGELAERAGHNDELEKVRAQIEIMREKSRSRLGRRFELLLGQQHDYGSFDEELIERYVCLGDDFDDEEPVNETQGRFADITKSAELFLHRPQFPVKLCIRDTPGVNDTFMMREQITIRAVRDSRICVVVLSAQQALSSVDMALIRLISNIRSREVVIFVNRIDELPDPANQIDEIRASIQATLKTHDGPTDAEIVFGSAHWANLALTGTVDLIDEDSRTALQGLAGQDLSGATPQDTLLELVWEHSGVPALYNALGARIAEGVGKDAISRVAKSAVNLAQGVKATSDPFGASTTPPELRIERATLMAELEAIGERAFATLNTTFDAQLESYHARLDRSHRSFLERATASLVEHLERHGADEVWKYEPTGLRLLLRTAYQVFGAKAQAASKNAFEIAAGDFSELFGRAFKIQGANPQIQAPPAAHIPPPVLLGQTIALDIQGNWWRNWWRRRRGYTAFATEFYSMIEAETKPIVDDLKVLQTDAVRRESHEILRKFLDEQCATLVGFADHQPEESRENDDGVLVLGARDLKRTTVEDTIAALDPYAA